MKKETVGWLVAIVFMVAFLFVLAIAFAAINNHNNMADRVDLYRMQIEGLTPALEACEESEAFWIAEFEEVNDVGFQALRNNAYLERDMETATLRITTAYELLNALTLTIGDGDSVIRYQKILDNIELIDDPTLDNMMDGWMLNADEDESMLMLLEIIKYLLIDAEFYLLPR